MTDDELRELLGDHDAVAAGPLSAARQVANICNNDPGSPKAREMVIRALEQRVAFSNVAGMLDILAQQVGLFPYAQTEKLGFLDHLAHEAHAPLNLKINGNRVIFHSEQAEVYRALMDGQSVVLSAPTSFGKSLIIDALIASGRYLNVVIIVPTIALIDETRRRLGRFRDSHKIITHPDQPAGDANIFVLTQERGIDLEPPAEIDLLVIDEFYKLDARSPAENDRAAALNHVFYKLKKNAKQIYLLGPHINEIPEGFGERFTCIFKRTNFNTVVSQVHRLSREPDRETAFLKLCEGLDGQSLVYCKSPKQANTIMRYLAAAAAMQPDGILQEVSRWVADTYHHEWTLCQALERGIGLHHGRIPRALAQLMVALFNEGHLRYLICTSSLIEGVNTSAKNVVIYESKIGNPRLDYFTFRNIQGRAGRMRQHFIGNVYTFDDAPDAELDFVDVPVYSQNDDVSLGLLMQIDEGDLKPISAQRVAEVENQDVLSVGVIRKNAHIEPEDQIALARVLTEDRQRVQPLLAWHGPYPTWEQLAATCDVLFKYLIKAPRQGVFSGKQLAFRLNQMRQSDSTSDFIRVVLENERNIDTADDAVESAMEFTRNWAGFTFPRYLSALNLIQQEIFPRFGLASGDYSAYAAEVEHLFLPAELPQLDEYGLPVEVGRKVQQGLELGIGLDGALVSLQKLDLAAFELSPFECGLIERCRKDL